jgi:hypothetical protein
VSSPRPHLRTEIDPVSETFYFLITTIPDDGQSKKKSSNSDLQEFQGNSIIVEMSFLEDYSNMRFEALTAEMSIQITIF